MKVDLYTVILSVFLLISYVWGCTSSSNWEVVHPDYDRLPPDEEVDYSIDISEMNYNPLPNFFHPDSLRHIATIGNFGNSSVDDRYYYQIRPTKIDIDHEGKIYITQNHTNTIKIYSRKGRYLYSIGKGGKGPGEFLQLVTFSFDKGYEKLYVLDAFEIEIFIRKKDRYEYKTTAQHGLLRAYDICVLEDDLFISGYKIAGEDKGESKPGKAHDITLKVAPPITRIDGKTFEHIRSFGFEYTTHSGYGTYEGILSQMMLSCNKYSETIVGYQKDFPYIFGYSIDGQQKWISKTEGYKVPKHIEFKSPENTRPGLIRYTNERMYNRKYPVQKIYHNEYELLQFVNQPPQKYYAASDDIEVKELKFRSILLNTVKGAQFYSDAYDRIGLKKGNIVITEHRNPDTYQRIIKIHEIK